jgi:dipeptidyl aminopeptidase/acylaminoacyl peptidase
VTGPERHPYGTHPSQFFELWCPSAGAQHGQLVILLHGGFWRAAYGLELMEDMAIDLSARGYGVANLEYRRVGDGGGYPMTLQDLGAALEALDRLADLDASRPALIGHSAGGQLALWLASRRQVAGVVSLAGVTDLEEADRRHLGAGAADAFLGGAAQEVPERYAASSPIRLLPLGVPQLLVHGDQDDRVPIELSQRYAQAAQRAGDADVILETFAGVEHFEPIDPRGRTWPVVVDALTRWLGPARPQSLT